MRAGRELGDVEDGVLVELSGVAFALQNAYLDAAIEAYRYEARALLRIRERERAVLAGTVLSGVPEPGGLWEIAEALRLPLDGAFLVVVASAKLGRDPMPRVEAGLAAGDLPSVWQLEPEYSLGLVSIGTPGRADGVLEVLRRHVNGPTGVSPVFTSLHGAPRAARLARLALDGVPADVRELRQLSDRPLDLLVASAPHATADTVAAVLGAVLDLPPDDRDLLLDTLGAWIEGGGSTQEAAARLHCHPNTVRYRMRRIEATTGRTLTCPVDSAEIVAAYRGWTTLPRHRRP